MPVPHVVIVTNKQFATDVKVYGPFDSPEVAATWAFHKAPAGLVEFKPLHQPERVDDEERFDWLFSNYSQACLEHSDPSVQRWAGQPIRRVRIARLAKDRYGWDLRKILDLLKTEQYAGS